MTTPKFTYITPQGLENLSRNFPFFLMIILLIPFYYLTSLLSAEKESKAREGMKMMGLKDNMYYLALFIFYTTVCILVSLIISIMCKLYVFKNNDFSVFFVFCLLYSMSFFGISFMVVAFIPTKRSSSSAATLFHII